LWHNLHCYLVDCGKGHARLEKFIELTPGPYLLARISGRLSVIEVMKPKPHGLQGCQMVHSQTKNPNLGKFWRALEWKMLVYFMVICNILRPFGIFYGRLVIIWYIFPVLVLWSQEKSGNPGGFTRVIYFRKDSAEDLQLWRKRRIRALVISQRFIAPGTASPGLPGGLSQKSQFG
jgi:hypothetical protein